MARPAPATAAGTAASRPVRAVSAATCRSEPPLARSMASSTSRRATIIRAAIRITVAPITIRLTNSSSRTVSMAAWVARNSDRFDISGEVTVSVSAAGSRAPVSPAGELVALVRAPCRPRTSAAVTPPTSSGKSQYISRPGPTSAFCTATNWSGSAMTPPTQYG